ncbi:DUF1353 domain-containing protein [Chryseobacterium turcicum]|uniref:DUF1353 domain-containing protein n=1 Tax=Chryseobacterium turcicum TaxID=2898076 RepID=A0A9Q3V2E3_9FLAO|nr:DUF1353 domain-containing protein [Chryseobacterium turcicum]MCD1117579.1 DUF1353 domain-containing protein [Chryseobacterium turcicum]
MKLILLLLFFPLVLSSQQTIDKFIGDVTVQWLNDGRSMKLKREFSYIDPDGKLWKVPKNTVVNGASIPQAFWTIIGGPYEGKYRNASVVHDYHCDKKIEKWQDVHLMFYHACLTGGTSITKAKIMYAAVYAGGPRWDTTIIKNGKEKIITTSTVSTSSNEMKIVTDWIESTNPSLEEINKRLDTVVIETEKHDMQTAN